MAIWCASLLRLSLRHPLPLCPIVSVWKRVVGVLVVAVVVVVVVVALVVVVVVVFVVVV